MTLTCDLTEQQIDHMVNNSFTNFHVKGFDYLCLKRSAFRTEKIYFFEGDVSHLPEVVNPHNHRYNFVTKVLAGTMSDSRYDVYYGGSRPRGGSGQLYHRHEWDTPLNGGDGARYIDDVWLNEKQRKVLKPETAQLVTGWGAVHTIRMHSDTCVLHLTQYQDVVPADCPTTLYMAEKQGVNLDGLYEKPTVDQVLRRYAQYQELAEAQGVSI